MKTLKIPLTNPGVSFSQFSVEMTDNSVVVITYDCGISSKKVEQIRVQLSLDIEKYFGKKIPIFAVKKGTKIGFLNFEKKDIMLVKMSEDNFTSTNTKFVVDMIKEALDVAMIEEQIGILVVKDPTDVLLLDDDSLLRLGLIKLEKIAETYESKEYSEIMEKLGFEKVAPFEERIKENTEETTLVDEKPLEQKIYITHTNENYSLKKLALLYDVDECDCIDSSDNRVTHHQVENMKHLYPRLDGKWDIPEKCGR